MTWFRVDDGLAVHAKVVAAGNAAMGLWVRAGAWSAGQHNGGYFPPEMLAELDATYRQADALVEAGLWWPDGDGWRFDRDRLCAFSGSNWRWRIPAAVRRTVFDRDGSRCVLCRTTDDLTLDHIRPWSRGGGDGSNNLRVLCRVCNSRKGATL